MSKSFAEIARHPARFGVILMIAVAVAMLALPGAAMVVVSAEVDTNLQRDARALRIAELLEKPINPHELRAIVRGLQT